MHQVLFHNQIKATVWVINCVMLSQLVVLTFLTWSYFFRIFISLSVQSVCFSFSHTHTNTHTYTHLACGANYCEFLTDLIDYCYKYGPCKYIKRTQSAFSWLIKLNVVNLGTQTPYLFHYQPTRGYLYFYDTNFSLITFSHPST